jgi:genome maintenance exonuclease 1
MNFVHELVEEDYSLDQQTSKKGRVYVDDEGNKYPSITTVLSILNKDAIIAWRKRVGEEEANKISTRAATRGTKVHDMIERYVLNEDPGEPDLISLSNFNDVKPIIDNSLSKVYATEKRMFSKHLGVAGTVDCVGVWNGQDSIIDWKTSAKFKKKEWISNYFMQCSAYAIMWEERTGVPIKQLVVCIAGDAGAQVFVEDRDNWTEDLINTISEYNRRKNGK